MLFLLLLSFQLSGWMGGSLYAQSNKTTLVADELWPAIGKQLEHSKTDTSVSFIIPMVRNRCGGDYDCLYSAYFGIMLKLERAFNLVAAIFVAEQMAVVAKQYGKIEEEANAYRNLSRFHGALGNDRLTIVNLEKALKLYEKTGNQSQIIHTKAGILERSLSYRNPEEILSEMEALLARAIELKDTSNLTYLYIRLTQHTENAGFYDKMEEHVAALENIPVSNPIQPAEYGIVIHAAMGRARLFMVKKNYAEAERFYQKTLRLCQAEPSRWLEIHVFHTLVRLEWEWGNAQRAKSYLDSAFVKAEKLQLHELLASNYELKAMIAEAEKRYADALGFTQKSIYHRHEFDNRGAGFDMRNYYLQLEKDQLTAEKEKQALELRLKNNQLRYSLIITFLVLLLAAGLTIGLYKQRKGKRELAAQNILIRQQSEQLKSLDSAKSRFFANVSHELRTPLTLLLGPIHSILKEENLTARQGKLLQMASRSGKHLNRLINQILDLRKLELGKMAVNPEPTSLASFFLRHFAQFESLAHRQQIDFSFEIKMGEKLAANIDREKCRQIVNNLLSNAFKFTPDGGRIAAKVTVNNGQLEIQVADNGQGIAPGDLPYIFDRFFQANMPGQGAGGTGIGLALCHEYVQLFGGEITVGSKLGKGSVFRLWFPINVFISPVPDTMELNQLDEDTGLAAAAPGKPQTTPATDTGNGKPTILVVEDNLELQDYIRLILEEKYLIITASNGEEALEVLQSAVRNPQSAVPNPDNRSRSEILKSEDRRLQTEGLPDLILSDLMMPVMDGYQLLEKLKSDDTTRHIPVVMLTARAEGRDRLKALRIGVDDYLTKPFDEEELRVRIENLLKNYITRQKIALVAESNPDHEHIPAINSEPNEGNLLHQKPASRLSARPMLSAPDSEWLGRLEENLQAALSNPDFNLEQLAGMMHVSRRQLGRQVKSLTGLTPSLYLHEARLRAARQLLEESQFKTVKEVAFAVGLREAKHFSKQFKKRFGKVPSDLLERH